MRRARRRVLALAITGVALTAACSPSADVEVEQANRSAGPLLPDGQAAFPDSNVATDPSVGAPAPETSIEWSSCAPFGIPDHAVESSPGWECGRLTVAMDGYADAGSTTGLPDVELAVTRHAATGERRGAIVLNPGGPGAAGLPMAWGIRQAMPTDLLRGFDIVAWDPRGIGQSTPRIDCDGGDSFDDGFIEHCVETTGELSGYLSAPYNAADMEALRIALGEDQLNFLGFSYGSVLGATYADRFSESVGAFVLDGATSPLVGSSDGPFSDGFATFADDGRDEAYDRLLTLCDATERCLPERDAEDVVDELWFTVDMLSTDRFAGSPDEVDTVAFELLIDVSLVYAGDWELLATALDDADDGDASALAALIADDEAFAAGGDGQDPVDGGVLPDNFDDANFLIYCADFGPVITRWSFCDAMPINAEPLQPVTSVDLDTPVLVIGTEYDPLTPGRHAPEFAEALGDATHMIWEGVGHTAFPGWTDCIDDAVADHFLGNGQPPDGTRCAMVEGVTADTELADQLFGFDRAEAENWIEDAIVNYGTATGDPACLAADIVGPATSAEVDDQLVTHLVLDVTSDKATVALEAAEARC